MRALICRDPNDNLGALGYEVIRTGRGYLGNSFQHGIFFFENKKYSIELVRFSSEAVRDSFWLVSKVSVYEKQKNGNLFPVLIFDYKELLMRNSNQANKIFYNAYLVLIDNIPMIGICHSEKGIVHVYEMDDLYYGKPIILNNFFMRFREKSLQRIIQLKSIVSWVLEKKFYLFFHERDTEAYYKFIKELPPEG